MREDRRADNLVPVQQALHDALMRHSDVALLPGTEHHPHHPTVDHDLLAAVNDDDHDATFVSADASRGFART